MKVSKTSLLLVVLGILIIAFANLSAMHSQQVSGQKLLDEELALARTRLDKIKLDELYVRQSDLMNELEETSAQVEASKNALSGPLDSIEVSSTLLDLAAQNSVRVTSITSSGVSPDDLEGIAASALNLTIRVEADLPELLAFVSALNNRFSTGLARSVDLSVAPALDRPSASINLAIYSYQGK